MAEASLAGQDKLSFVISPPLKSFAFWLEQLVAESRQERQGRPSD